MISEQVLSPTFDRVIANNVQTGSGRLQSKAYRLKCQMADLPSTIGATGRQRYAAIHDVTDPDHVWKVPRSEVVLGVTISASSDNITILKALSSRLVNTSIADAESVPCGEMAFTLHRTSDDLTSSAHLPAGSYIVGNIANERGSSATLQPYNPAATNQYGQYFQYFLANCNGHAQSLTISNNADAGDWNTTIRFRQQANGQHIGGQAGAPVVYAAAERSLFGNMTESGVYVPFTTGAGLVSDGTWGMAIGFVAEASYHESTGATQWNALEMDVTVHVASVG